ncbi:YfcL family protein [Paraferrimonas sedimenticola]|uniref:YfcL protein n=1 Tax=Paraferrimonas sedimenticola TaxID=375674 RepID=A0AA37W1Q1_9GAMM|nr:YfcL family protein [Paraferrimonas sedimenticola]GLP96582.1 hypothetical protein GCM10007895_18880 [Paraferrimonas sedimenticola]
MLEQYEQQLDSWMAHQVDNANDDELFAAGYLQGHVTVALSEVEASGESNFESLSAAVAAALKGAESELSAEDQELVANAWADLQQHLS